MLNIISVLPRFFVSLRLAGVIAALAASLAVPTHAGANMPAPPPAPPTIVIDAEVTSAQPVGYVLYLPHDQEMLAMDVTSGAIRAVFPAPRPTNHGVNTTLAALTAGTVPVPALGMLMLATLFAVLVGMVFLRRPPTSV